jgi:hypothetical protein
MQGSKHTSCLRYLLADRRGTTLYRSGRKVIHFQHLCWHMHRPHHPPNLLLAPSPPFSSPSPTTFRTRRLPLPCPCFPPTLFAFSHSPPPPSSFSDPPLPPPPLHVSTFILAPRKASSPRPGGNVRAAHHEVSLLGVEAARPNARPQEVPHGSHAGPSCRLAQRLTAREGSEHGLNEVIQIRLEGLSYPTFYSQEYGRTTMREVMRDHEPIPFPEDQGRTAVRENVLGCA